MSGSPQPNPPTSVHDEGRSSRKRRAILQAATKAFLQQGYRGTSMDEIAALAGVSKQTVYKHFADKKRLFSEIVLGTVTEASDPVHNEVLKLTDSGDVEADLRDLARRQVATVMQPHLLQLRRLVIAEVGRFPELGRTFYEQGPERTIAALAEAFERAWTDRRAGPRSRSMPVSGRGRSLRLVGHVAHSMIGATPRHGPALPAPACRQRSTGRSSVLDRMRPSSRTRRPRPRRRWPP